ncbi:MAG: ABC transporter substrate-binding protein [Burkholderiales bacterium]
MITRRDFVCGVSAASALGLAPKLLAAEPPPETQRIRLVRDPSVCLAPLYVAEDLLRQEGFRDISYPAIEQGRSNSALLASGKADFGMDAAPALIMGLDAGERFTILAGVHAGCYELFASVRIRTIRDLKGATIAITQERDDRHAFVASFLTHVGLNPRTDVKWVTHPAEVAMRFLEEGKIDAFLGFAPEPQELRARKIGHSLLSILTDRPWSQYFCCLLIGSRDFVRKHPVATRRAMRAILKANAICAAEPERVNKLLVDKGYVTKPRFALQALREIPYARWREFEPADTLRFYSLRLREGGMIKSSPDKIITEGANFRFLDELKNELKA